MALHKCTLKQQKVQEIKNLVYQVYHLTAHTAKINLQTPEKYPVFDCKLYSNLVSVCAWSVPSVLRRFWLGGRKGIRPVKNWVVGCWHGYLSGAYGPADATARGAPDLDPDPDPARYPVFFLDPAGSKHYGSGPPDSCVTNLPTTVSMHYVFYLPMPNKNIEECMIFAIRKV